MGRLLIGPACLAYATAAASAPPVYFHKADVDRETFAADFGECNELTGGVRAPRMTVYSPNMYAMAAGSFFAAFFKGAEQRSMENNVLRTCMADKGYRRVEATGGIRKELKSLKLEARVDRLFALAAAPQAQGKVLPR